MPYIYHTDDEKKEMLEYIGISSEEELFNAVPPSILLKDNLPLGEGMTEFAVKALMEKIGGKNKPAGTMISFLGGGAYDHYIPSVVDHLSGRSEFYTAYTPYQPEVSQGTLQAIFEFQTMISRLTGLPVANASMYDGATALAEAVSMAVSIKKRDAVIYPESLNPRFLNVLKTYTRGRDITLVPVPFTDNGQIDAPAMKRVLDEKIAAVIMQTPNYFGVLEKPWDICEAIEKNNSLLISVVDPVSLALVRAPGDYGADIAVGEAQSLGNAMSYGGPLLGFISCRQSLIRQMPGRIVSRTKDIEGKEAYVLVLQTREQHIRREKATSNICTNEGLIALRATIYLAVLGKKGFSELGCLCHEKSSELARMITQKEGYRLKFRAPFFQEFVVECPVPAEKVVEDARSFGILAGIPLGRYFGSWAKNCLLIAVTEKRSDSDLKLFSEVLGRIKNG